MIGFYNYTVILTYIGMLSGFVGITYMINGNLKMALICLMIAGFCDMFDGKIASTMKRTKQEKRFGIQIDSLSDLICFGVLPALIGFCCSDGTVLSIIVCGIYLLCALIRLAWFNVDEEERQEKEASNRKFYLGLPVTSSAVLLPLFIGTVQLLNWNRGKTAILLLLGIAAAFLTPIRLKKPGLAGAVVVLLLGMAGFIIVVSGGTYER